MKTHIESKENFIQAIEKHFFRLRSIKMTTQELIQQIDELDLPEKLNLVEKVWDSIAGFPKNLPIPDWHKVELDHRYQEWKEGKLELHDWEDVHSDIRKKYQ